MVYYNKFCTYKSFKSFSWWFLIYPSHAWILHLSQCDDDKIVWTVSLCDRHPDYVMAAHTYRIWKLSFYINKKVTYKNMKLLITDIKIYKCCRDRHHLQNLTILSI